MDDEDPILRALERSTIAQTLKAARASLAEPSRPYTPLDRSLFQQGDASPSRPSSSYSADQLSFVRDTYGNRPESAFNRPESARSSRSSRSRAFEPIAEEGSGFDGGAYSREGGADVLRLGGADEGAASSGSEELTPVTVSGPSGGPAPPRGPPPSGQPARPPRPPTGGYPSAASAAASARHSGGYSPEVAQMSPSERPPSRDRPRSSSRKAARDGSLSKESGDGTPKKERRHKASSKSPAPRRSPGDLPAWDVECEAVITKLQSLAAAEASSASSGVLAIAERLWTLVSDLKAGTSGSSKAERAAGKLLRAVLGLMDMKDTLCLFKLARSALALLQFEDATRGVHANGVQAAYMNVAKVLFKCSKVEGHDRDFLKEGLVGPLLEVLRSRSSECTGSDLRVYIVGVLKNISNSETNQQFLLRQDAVTTLFSLMDIDQLTGSSKEAQLLIQITATLRNLATEKEEDEEENGQDSKTSEKAHQHFLPEDRLSALTRMMALFPGQLELLTNVSRILAKLTLHGAACEALCKNDAHLRQMATTLSSSADSAPLALRLGFVLGNLTARSDRVRIKFGFDCEGNTLVPQLLRRYWQKDRQLARVELETGKAAGSHEVEEVLVKLVRLLANIAISPSIGPVLASSSAVVDPLLDMLGAKRIGDSEELVLNVVSAVTNLLFYDVPSNLLMQDENKQLLCRLFRPLLLESYNEEALMETARALGNLSRHEDSRRYMTDLRVDEVLVILLNHHDRDLVYYICGALVNLATDPDCIVRLSTVCPVVEKLAKLLCDAPDNDPALQLVAVKVLTNLSLHPSIQWSEEDGEALRNAINQMVASAEHLDGEGEDEEEVAERQQMLELSRLLLGNLGSLGNQLCDSKRPVPAATQEATKLQEALVFMCQVEGCGRKFDTKEKLAKHLERRHGC